MAEPKKTSKAVKALRIVAKREGFRRAGYEFGQEARDIPLADLEKEQIEQLKNDPSLLCVEVGVTADEAAE